MGNRITSPLFNQSSEIIEHQPVEINIKIDDLLSKTNIRLFKSKSGKITIIKGLEIDKSIYSYKLESSDIYNLLLEQLNMDDSLVIHIINHYNKTLHEHTIIINNIKLFNRLMYIFSKDKQKYTYNFYGMYVGDIPIHDI